MKAYIYQLDGMRVLGAVAVVLLHVAAKTLFLFEPGIDPKWWIGNLIASTTHFAVPLFFMISGSIFLRKAEKNLHHLKKVFLRLGLPLVLASVLYSIFYSIVRNQPLSLTAKIYQIIFDQPFEHLFFFFALIPILLLKFFWQGWKNLRTRYQLLIILLLSTVTLMWTPNRFVGLLFVPYLSYFFWGDLLLRSSDKKRFNVLAFLLLTLSTCGMLWMTWRLTTDGIPTNDGFWAFSYFSPLVFIQSLSLFWLMSQVGMQKNGLTQFISQKSLGIYIIHPAILWFVEPVLVVSESSAHVYFIQLLITTTVVFLLSTMFIWLWTLVTAPLSSKLQTVVLGASSSGEKSLASES